MRLLRLPFALAAFNALGFTAFAATEHSVTVQRVFGKASSKPETTLAEGAKFTTGTGGKAELASRRGVVRVGEKAELDMARSGGIALRQGVTLVASNPGAFRKTIEVRAPGYRARIRGTAQIAYDPGRALKVVVLEGEVTVSLDSLAGEFETLTPGQQLIINPSDNRLPEPVEIDLGRLVATSQMVNGQFGALATQPLIDESLGGQGAGLRRGDLARTPFFLTGLDNDLQARDHLRNAPPKPVAPKPQVVERTIFRSANDIDDPRAIVREKPAFDGVNQTTLPTPSSGGALTITRTGAKTNLLRVGMTTNFTSDPVTGAVTPTAAPRLDGTIRVDPDVFSGSPKALEFAVITPDPGFDRLQIVATADIETPPGVGLSFRTTGADIISARLQAGKATSNSELLSITSSTGDINVGSSANLKGGRISVAGGSLSVQPQTLNIDTSATLTANRRLSVGSDAVKTGINIRNSSELASLIDSLDLLSGGGAITIDGSKLTARKMLTIDSFAKNFPSDPAVVNLKSIQAMANLIRVRAFSPSGDALIIDGSTFNASQFIRLYAEGASTLRFRNTVNLTTPRADLAGKTVEVDPGGAVNISGKGNVFTDQSNFNTGPFGTIQAGGGLKVSGFGKRPKF